jgi:cytosine/uracil/thiamine/allantoin permease
VNGDYGTPLVAFAQLEVLLLWGGVAILVVVVILAIWLAKKCEGE